MPQGGVHCTAGLGIPLYFPVLLTGDPSVPAIFCCHIPAIVAEALENDDWKDYAQAVHAGKGALAGIGAQ